MIVEIESFIFLALRCLQDTSLALPVFSVQIGFLPLCLSTVQTIVGLRAGLAESLVVDGFY